MMTVLVTPHAQKFFPTVASVMQLQDLEQYCYSTQCTVLATVCNCIVLTLTFMRMIILEHAKVNLLYSLLLLFHFIIANIHTRDV